MTLLLVALVSIVLAAIMSGVAWRTSRDERRRSDARIAALAAAIHGGPAMQPPEVSDPLLAFDGDELAMRPAVAGPGGDLFAAPLPARGGSRFAAVAAGGLFVCGSAVALAVVSSNASGDVSHSVADRSGPVAPVSGEPRSDPSSLAAPPPVELVALGYEREGDRLIVRGVLRNPSSGAALDGVTAVVFLFKEDGGFLTSGRATVDAPALGPGGETAFAVTVPGANGVGRYRVSFRSENRVVPHVDRRSRT